jgi:protein-tyrosine phosphatase
MAGYVDIHSHLLPGIDDGPDDLEQALSMARTAVECGIDTLAATPHLRADFPGVHIGELADRATALRAELARKEIPLNVVQAAEVSLVWALEASPEDLVRATFGGQGQDMLVETPGQVTMIEQLLYQLRLHGLRVTLGHPERSLEFQRDPEQLRRVVDQGVLLQVNADSLLGHWRGGARSLAEWLCREGLAHAIASDGHRGRRWRPVALLPEAVQLAAELVGEARATWLASEAPAAIVAGRPLPPAPEIEARPRRRRRFLGIG